MVGIITGRSFGKNIDGDKTVVLLQVELLENEDVKTIELFSNSNEDVNPANGCRVNITKLSDSYRIGSDLSDGLTPVSEPGEKEIYSTDNPVTTKLAKIKCDKNGNVIFNNGINHATQQEALQTAINTFLIALNGQLVGLGGAGGLTLDITTSKVSTVKLP